MKQITKELSRFVVAGCGAVGTDLAVYYALLQMLSPNMAKTISFLCGTIVAYVINKYWTFEQPQKSTAEAVLFLLLYLITLVINVATNRFMLTVTGHSVFLAFLIATGTSTVLNFIGQKFWVFNKNR